MSGARLGDLLAALEPSPLWLLHGPADTGRPLGRVLLLDATGPRGPAEVAAGDVVLLPGVRADTPDGTGVLDGCRAAGAAALVLRTEAPDGPPGTPPADVPPADVPPGRAGAAVLLSPPALGWDTVLALVQAAARVAGTRPRPPHPSPAAHHVAAWLARACGSPVLVTSREGRPAGASAGWDGPRPDDVVVPVEVSGEPCGELRIATGGRPLDDPGRRHADAAAAAAALSSMLAAAAAQRERARRHGLVAQLFGGDGAAPVWAAHLAGGHARSLVAALGPTGSPVPREVRAAGDLVRLWLAGTFPTAVYAARGGTGYAILPGADPHAARVALEEMCRAVRRRTGVLLLAGLGDAVERPEHLPHARATAEEALRLLADPLLTPRRGGGPARGEGPLVAGLEHLWTARTLDVARGAVGAGPSLADDIAAHDRVHGTGYTRTLRVHLLDCAGSAARTARALGLHENTLRHRLRRAQELFGLDLADRDRCLALALQLRLRVVEPDDTGSRDGDAAPKRPPGPGS
ncbi:PucR family transcriptional regulator [Kineococcus sp. NUM-3379]